MASFSPRVNEKEIGEAQDGEGARELRAGCGGADAGARGEAGVGGAAGNPMPRPLRSGGPMPRPRRSGERRGSAPIGGRKRPHDGRRPGVNGPGSQSWSSEFP